MSSINVVLTYEELKHVDKLAESQGVSHQAVVRDAVAAFLKAHPADKINKAKAKLAAASKGKE